MTGALPFNLIHFARLLRRIGLKIGPGRVITATTALQAIDLSRRDDVYWTLHAVLVDRHADMDVFRMAFDRFWRTAGNAAADSLVDTAKPDLRRNEVKPLPRRLAEAFAASSSSPDDPDVPPETASVSWSGAERLRTQDFETMSAAELAQAKRLMQHLRLPIPEVATRRFRAGRTGPRIDMRATLRAMVREGGAIDLRRRRRVLRHPPVVVLCDISGSMAAYARMLLHFLHAVTTARDRVQIFLFGTRLTNVTREMAQRDPDEALQRVSHTVKDWSGGTRIGQTVAAFNRLWSRRVLGQGAVVLVISDGLDRDGGEGLAREMERLQRSCRRLIWLNPLLRFDGFEPKSAGIRAMLPYVDDFRPVHNLDSLAALVAALAAPAAGRQRHAA